MEVQRLSYKLKRERKKNAVKRKSAALCHVDVEEVDEFSDDDDESGTVVINAGNDAPVVPFIGDNENNKVELPLQEPKATEEVGGAEDARKCMAATTECTSDREAKASSNNFDSEPRARKNEGLFNSEKEASERKSINKGQGKLNPVPEAPTAPAPNQDSKAKKKYTKAENREIQLGYLAAAFTGVVRFDEAGDELLTEREARLYYKLVEKDVNLKKVSKAFQKNAEYAMRDLCAKDNVLKGLISAERETFDEIIGDYTLCTTLSLLQPKDERNSQNTCPARRMWEEAKKGTEDYESLVLKFKAEGAAHIERFFPEGLVNGATITHRTGEQEAMAEAELGCMVCTALREILDSMNEGDTRMCYYIIEYAAFLPLETTNCGIVSSRLKYLITSCFNPRLAMVIKSNKLSFKRVVDNEDLVNRLLRFTLAPDRPKGALLLSPKTWEDVKDRYRKESITSNGLQNELLKSAVRVKNQTFVYETARAAKRARRMVFMGRLAAAFLDIPDVMMNTLKARILYGFIEMKESIKDIYAVFLAVKTPKIVHSIVPWELAELIEECPDFLDTILGSRETVDMLYLLQPCSVPDRDLAVEPAPFSPRLIWERTDIVLKTVADSPYAEPSDYAGGLFAAHFFVLTNYYGSERQVEFEAQLGRVAAEWAGVADGKTLNTADARSFFAMVECTHDLRDLQREWFHRGLHHNRVAGSSAMAILPSAPKKVRLLHMLQAIDNYGERNFTLARVLWEKLCNLAHTEHPLFKITVDLSIRTKSLCEEDYGEKMALKRDKMMNQRRKDTYKIVGQPLNELRALIDFPRDDEFDHQVCMAVKYMQHLYCRSSTGLARPQRVKFIQLETKERSFVEAAMARKPNERDKATIRFLSEFFEEICFSEKAITVIYFICNGDEKSTKLVLELLSSLEIGPELKAK